MKTNRNLIGRQSDILKHIQRNGRVLVEDLAVLFKTTPQTIRKDLSALAEVNQIVRFHGGAALVGGTEYTSFSVREAIAREQKDAIGRVVAGQIPNNSSLMINAGTTTAAAAGQLAHHAGLTVVTDSVVLADRIRAFSGLDVIIPGGTVRKSDGSILGEAAVEFLRQFRVDIAVIGAAAISRDGTLLVYDLREAHVVRTIIQNARAVILAADSTKFGRAAPVSIGRIEDIQTLVTDRGCPTQLKEICSQSGTRLVLAG